jgi:hypothetical protein
MANDTSTGYASNWNVAPVTGSEIVTFSAVEFPFLSRIGGRRVAASDEIAMSAQYALEAFAQPAITEAGSTTAPTAVAYDRSNEVNAIQIFQKSVNVTYARQSAANRLKFAEVSTSGYAYSNDPLRNPVMDELAFQVNAARQQLYGDLEISTLTGSYQKATSAAVANKMRGIVTASTTNTVDASSAQLEKGLINELLREMATNGSRFIRPVIFCGAYQKQKLSDIYGYVPMDRRVGGLNIQMIETDFGVFEVMFSRNITAGTMLFADMAAVNLVSQPVPGKAYMPDGLFFLEELSKTGASEKYQMYGQLSIDYGSSYYHGTLTNLATA